MVPAQRAVPGSLFNGGIDHAGRLPRHRECDDRRRLRVGGQATASTDAKPTKNYTSSMASLARHVRDRGRAGSLNRQTRGRASPKAIGLALPGSAAPSVVPPLRISQRRFMPKASRPGPVMELLRLKLRPPTSFTRKKTGGRMPRQSVAGGPAGSTNFFPAHHLPGRSPTGRGIDL